MARVSVYLNFAGTTEKAFNFYKTVFGGEFNGGVNRFRDIPPDPSRPPMPESELDLVMHMELPILGGFVLMGSDVPGSMGFPFTQGNNVYINLEPDSRQEADRLFSALSAGGSVGMPMADMFWGAYFGMLTDQFGIHWMVNFTTSR